MFLIEQLYPFYNLPLIFSLGFVLARSIAEKGISKRFRYKGSGFIEAVKKETKEEIKKILKEGYRKDIAAQLKTLKAIK